MQVSKQNKRNRKKGAAEKQATKEGVTYGAGQFGELVGPETSAPAVKKLRKAKLKRN